MAYFLFCSGLSDQVKLGGDDNAYCVASSHFREGAQGVVTSLRQGHQEGRQYFRKHSICWSLWLKWEGIMPRVMAPPCSPTPGAEVYLDV